MVGREFAFVKGDVCDQACLDAIFAEWDITAVIHLAGLKAVVESVQQPLDYYGNNVGGTLTLCQAMRSAGVHRLVFSSSATVYGADAPVPYREDLPRGQPSSAYGASKSMIEQMLEELCCAENVWSVVLLRYFNPIGAHESGQIGEDPKGIPNNLLPYIAQVAAGRREILSIYGDDYPTADGTCERDYLHVMDLAEGHVIAMKHLRRSGIFCYNLGTGHPVSVLQMVSRFIAVNDVAVPYVIAPRRAGDLPAFWADPSKAQKELGWRARRSLDSMLRDTWHWQQLNPDGYT